MLKANYNSIFQGKNLQNCASAISYTSWRDGCGCFVTFSLVDPSRPPTHPPRRVSHVEQGWQEDREKDSTSKHKTTLGWCAVCVCHVDEDLLTCMRTSAQLQFWILYTRSGETELVDSFISSCRPWPIQIKVEEPPYKLYKYMYAIRMEIYEPEQW